MFKVTSLFLSSALIGSPEFWHPGRSSLIVWCFLLSAPSGLEGVNGGPAQRKECCFFAQRDLELTFHSASGLGSHKTCASFWFKQKMPHRVVGVLRWAVACSSLSVWLFVFYFFFLNVTFYSLINYLWGRFEKDKGLQLFMEKVEDLKSASKRISWNSLVILGRAQWMILCERTKEKLNMQDFKSLKIQPLFYIYLSIYPHVFQSPTFFATFCHSGILIFKSGRSITDDDILLWEL